MASSTEHQEQVAYFQWVDTRKKLDPAFQKYCILTDDGWVAPIAAVPNGFRAGSEAGRWMLQEGLQPGFPDIIVAVPAFTHVMESTRGFYTPGLVIEMKAPGRRKQKNGGLQDNQMQWRDLLIKLGWKHIVAYNWEEAARATAEYMEVKYE